MRSKEKRIKRFLEKVSGGAEPMPLRGDASTRSFYRIPFGRATVVMMVSDEPDADGAREFIDVRNHLAACGVAVPEIYEHDAENGVVLLEDFGDLTLEERLRGEGEATRRLFYRLAIEQLLRIQIIGTALPLDCVAFRRAFDEKKLMEELDFFLVHTVDGLYCAKIGHAEREEIRHGFAVLASRLANLPRVLNHRDYHSRNLMVMGEALGVVDFQDARMGPCQYDLASLLRDSYTVIAPDLRADMMRCYLERSGEMGIVWHDRDEFALRFDLMSIQRNLKACGTFGYMAVARGNDRYLPFLGPTFAYVKEVAPRFDVIAGCVRLLGRHIPALR